MDIAFRFGCGGNGSKFLETGPERLERSCVQERRIAPITDIPGGGALAFAGIQHVCGHGRLRGGARLSRPARRGGEFSTRGGATNPAKMFYDGASIRGR